MSPRTVLLASALTFAAVLPQFAHASACPSLSLGSTGASVTALQQLLYNSYNNFPAPTGYFGTITQAAVRQWQSEHGIVSSGTPATTGWGVVGPRTAVAMQLCGTSSTTPVATFAPSTQPPTTNTASANTAVARTLSRGMSGPDVVALQQFLISQNLLAAGNATGYLGALTEAAVQTFQAQHAIVSSGTPNTTGFGAVGPRTRTALSSAGVASFGNSSSTSGNTGIATNVAPTALVNVNAGNSQCSYFAMPRPAELCPQSGEWKPLMSGSCQIGWQCNTPVQAIQTQQIQSQFCTPLAAQTQTLSCPSGQTGSITQTRTSSCAAGATTPSWSGWTNSAGSCITPTASCATPWGTTVTHGGYVTAYQASSVASGGQCVSQTRTCANGQLSGTYTYSTCTPTASPTCTPLTTETRTAACASGQTGSITQTRTSSCATDAASPTWSAWTNSASSCVTPTASCTTPWGTTVTHGNYVTANLTSSVAYGSQCVSEQRICTNGQLSGMYTYQTCTPAAATCTPLTTETRTAACPTGQTGSITQTRTSSCATGATSPTWSGWTNTVNTCTTPAAQSCTTPWGTTVSSGASVTANLTTSVAYGSECISETRACTNGQLSGSYQYQTCTPATATCTALSPQTQTLTCPAGQTGTWTQGRTSSCATGATSPTWSVWTDTVKTCTQIQSNTIDVFLIAGQSNAVGYPGSSAGSPAVPAGKVLQYYNGTISDANDPVGNAQSGSAWPAFGAAYYSATGHRIAFVPAAVGGSGQLATSDTGTGNWSQTGSLFTSSTNKLDAAMTALGGAGYTPTFKGVLWSQGENDAIKINSGTVTASGYQSGLVSMIARYRERYGSSMPFYIFQTGTSPNESDAGYAAVRNAQAQVDTGDSLTWLVFGGAYGFAGRGLMADTYHYTQTGYNEMGTVGAQNVVAGTSATPAAPISAVNLKGNGSDGPVTVTLGNPLTWSWTSQNVTSCLMTWTGATSGSIDWGISSTGTTVTPSPAGNFVMTMTCQTPTGSSVSDSVNLTVSPVASAQTFSQLASALAAFSAVLDQLRSLLAR